ncbi:MAG: MotA/TolQ/ExbB proton channel family protein, partial [Planctomycetaceae bacterium]|nr:MotA/TolQ/ExbB proton channel family protein [Planctomycetaceae bacterium]
VLVQRENHKVDVRFVSRYIETLTNYEKKHGSSLLTQRLRTALQFVSRGGSAEELDTELRYLSEEEFSKADADYGLVRLILWAIPMIGFLGTVVGITMALSNLDLNSINESSKMLSAGLSLAFDTTALAIVLDVTLYFMQFIVYSDESNLLWEIDRHAGDELRGRFELETTSQDDSQIASVRRMMENVVLSIETLIEKQTKHWEHGIEAADKRYSQLTEQNAETMKIALAGALSENVIKHAALLAEVERRFIEQSRDAAVKVEESLRQNIVSFVSLQQEMLRQNEAVQQIIGANGQLMKNEQRLNENLAALAQVGNFEQTLNSLAAVIHLLNGKHSIGVHRDAA